MSRRSLLMSGSLVCGLLIACIGIAQAQGFITPRTLEVDLGPKIEAAAKERERFAVDVTHEASIADVGSWERSGGVSVWRYGVRIPTAVSMSFHADRFHLPVGATLILRDSRGARTTYDGDTGASGELWSRTVRGDAFTVELSVATAHEAEVEFSIASVQAGYRVLGGAAPDHPFYRKLQGITANAASALPCPENFACHETTENSLNADATGAIVIGGVALCTGTLVNNLRNDGRPYLLTARHCQDGPTSSITAYWDATVACGQSLATVYDTPTPSYFGLAQTVFEQQDVWMLDLGAPPYAARPYFAGWDVTGAAFVGGYSPHHAMGRSRQYVRWFGQASMQTMPRTVLGVGYDSNFWGVVNDVGSVGSGASGGGLFNSDHRLVGVASLAYLQNGPGSDGVCPVSPPPVPTVDSATALYVALSAVWDTNSDTTSFTNPATLKSLLDPDNTGLRVADGIQMLRNLTLIPSREVGRTGWQERLEWNAPGATSCVASGGSAGDGWAGIKAASGSQPVTQYESSVANYSLRCSNGARFSQRSVQIVWIHETPIVSLQYTTPHFMQVVGDRFQLRWSSNVQPCTASGGGAGDGWVGPKSPAWDGTQEVPFTQDGMITWTITCGSGARTATQSLNLSIAPVSAEVRATATNVRVNMPVTMLFPAATGLSCTKTGGVPGDEWAGPFFQGSNTRAYTSSMPGTVRYTLTCQSGAISATSFVDVTYTNDPAIASLTASNTSPFVIPPGTSVGPNWPPPNAIQLSWASNLAPCGIVLDAPGTDWDGPILLDNHTEGWSVSSIYNVQTRPGTYVYSLTCGSGSTTATDSVTVNWQSNGPVVHFVPLTEAILENGQYFLWWAGNVGPCTTGGGIPGDGWAGRTSTETSFGTITVGGPGSYTYSVSCSNGIDAVQDSIDIVVPPNAVSFTPHPSDVRAGESVWLTWTATTSRCTTAGDFPAGQVNGRSSLQVGSQTSGLRTYTLRCGAAEASTTINWLPPRTVEISASAANVPVGQPITLTWNTAHVGNCNVNRDQRADWFGDLPTSGTRTVTSLIGGSQMFWIECDGIFDFVSVFFDRPTRGVEPFEGPTLTFTADSTTKSVRDTLTLTWTTTRAAGCHVSQSPVGSGWTGNLAVSGTQQFQMLTAGTFLFGIECTGAPPRANAEITITVNAAPAPPPPSGGGSSSGGGGGGGGGRLDPLLLAGLTMFLLMLGARTRRRGVVS